jgi:hypothetical protein
MINGSEGLVNHGPPPAEMSRNFFAEIRAFSWSKDMYFLEERGGGLCIVLRQAQDERLAGRSLQRALLAGKRQA